MSDLALLGGTKTLESVEDGDIFRWPIITPEDEEAVLAVLRRGAMSGTDVTRQFEEELCAYFNLPHALMSQHGHGGYPSRYVGVWRAPRGRSDMPKYDLLGVCFAGFFLGATVVFGEMDPLTLTLDPADVESRITDRTKAIIVVHYSAYPTDMDPIMEIAERRGIKVIEDVSHAQGGLYKGRLLGTIGHVGAMSIMSGKSLPCGEGGFLVTEDKQIYERAVSFGHYQRSLKWRTLS